MTGIASFVMSRFPYPDVDIISDVAADLAATISEQDLLSDSYQDAAMRGIEFCPQCSDLVRVETRTADGHGECPVCYGCTVDATSVLVM